jgi:hypothetical protein
MSPSLVVNRIGSLRSALVQPNSAKLFWSGLPCERLCNHNHCIVSSLRDFSAALELLRKVRSPKRGLKLRAGVRDSRGETSDGLQRNLLDGVRLDRTAES